MKSLNDTTDSNSNKWAVVSFTGIFRNKIKRFFASKAEAETWARQCGIWAICKIEIINVSPQLQVKS